MQQANDERPAATAAPVDLVLGPLPEPDVFGYGSLDIREDVNAYSDDAMRAYAAEQVAAERDRFQRIRVLADQCAEWHVGDGDECGEIARELLSLLRA
jgi:hypothetical protein